MKQLFLLVGEAAARHAHRLGARSALHTGFGTARIRRPLPHQIIIFGIQIIRISAVVLVAVIWVTLGGGAGLAAWIRRTWGLEVVLSFIRIHRRRMRPSLRVQSRGFGIQRRRLELDLLGLLLEIIRLSSRRIVLEGLLVLLLLHLIHLDCVEGGGFVFALGDLYIIYQSLVVFVSVFCGRTGGCSRRLHVAWILSEVLWVLVLHKGQ